MKRPVLKKILFRAITLIPLLSILVVVSYFLFFTNLPQLLYSQSVRNLNFDCLEFSSASYVYKMKPGKCRVTNIEYDMIFTTDANGFRNGIRPSGPYDVAVIGDSHAHGFGVADNQTFSYLLESIHHFKTVNLAIGSYATMRELEVLNEYGRDAKYVVVQYCPNDFGENDESLRLNKEEFRSRAEERWRTIMRTYHEGKAMGYRKPLHDLAVMIRNHSYASKSTWKRTAEENREMEQEAVAFAQIVARYRLLLEGKRMIIFEVAGSGLNSPRFKPAFEVELNRLGWLNYELLNTSSILDRHDYFFLDDHINQSGHKKLAEAIAKEIEEWEGRKTLIVN
jgi:lysophospholipase L1-like esterase